MLKLALLRSGVFLVKIGFVIHQLPTFVGWQTLMLTKAFFEIGGEANVKASLCGSFSMYT